MFIAYFITHYAICCMLYALVSTSISNLGPYQVIFHSHDSILVLFLVPDAADLCSPIYHDTCLMPYASRSRPYPNERINYKIKKNFTLRSSDLLICLARSPCERGVTVTHCVTHFWPRNVWRSLIGCCMVRPRAIIKDIFLLGKYHSVSFLSREARTKSPRYIVNKSLYFSYKSVTRYLLCTAVYQGGYPVII